MGSSLDVVALRSVQISLPFEKSSNPNLYVIASVSIWVLIKQLMYLMEAFPLAAVGFGLEPYSGGLTCIYSLN